MVAQDQHWLCPKCGKAYDSPVRIKSISCSSGHKPAEMKEQS